MMFQENSDKTINYEGPLNIRRRYMDYGGEDHGFSIEKNISFVVRHSLCHGCGTCEAVCPESAVVMEFDKKGGIYLPVINNDMCTNCEICVMACSGFELDLEQRQWDKDKLEAHPLIGPYNKIYRAYSNNDEIRERAASGGLVTEIVRHLLVNKKVHGAILVRMSEKNPLVAEGYVARSIDEISESQKSKYCPVSLNKILRPIIYSDSIEKYVFVGLPHHVHGLRLVQQMFPTMQDRVPYVVSIFTAHVPSQRATEFILYKNGVKQEVVKTIEYRGGGNPGRMRIVTNDGVEHFVPHLHWTYSGHSFPLFFYPVREWLYFDKMSEWADFSCGDNWMGGIREQRGVSTVIARSKCASAIVEEMERDKKIVCSEMTSDQLVRDQVLREKLNVKKRLQVWRSLGRAVPIYTRKFEDLKGQTIRTYRFAFNVLISERGFPFWFMDKIIWVDYFLRAKPKKYIDKMMSVFKIFSKYDGAAIPKGDKYKVLFIGGYGHKDIGDESMPHALRLQFKEKMGDSLCLVMLSVDPYATVEMHDEMSVYDFTKIGFGVGRTAKHTFGQFITTSILVLAAYLEKRGYRLKLWRAAREAMNELADCDVLVNVGGGNINSIIPSELYKKCTTYLLASILDKPIYISGQTMGPYLYWYDKLYARWCLNKVRLISFRDKAVSQNRLHEIGVDKPVMYDAADDAMTLRGIPKVDAIAMLEADTGRKYNELTSGMLVYVNLKASLNVFKGKDRNSDLSAEILIVSKICDAIIDHYDSHVVLCATDFSEAVDDRMYHDKIYERTRNKDRIIVLQNEYNDQQLIGLIECADVVIGARYHAASVFTPFVGFASGVYQMTKLKGLADLCELPQCFIDADMEYADFEAVWPQIKSVIKSRGAIKEHLIKQVPQLRLNSSRIVDEVVSVVNKQRQGY